MRLLPLLVMELPGVCCLTFPQLSVCSTFLLEVDLQKCGVLLQPEAWGFCYLQLARS